MPVADARVAFASGVLDGQEISVAAYAASRLDSAGLTHLLLWEERADILIDFTAYAGKTVILYNDCPAPIPAGDPRIDYYTGNADYSKSGGDNNQGGAPSTP